MRAVLCRNFGPPDSLAVEEVPDPVAGPGEIVIEVVAAAVTFPDALMIEDKYQFKPKPPFIPGGEVAGRVLALGDGVEGFQEGDPVVGSAGLVGGFAEKATIGAAGTRKLTSNSGFAEATGLMYAYGTGYYGLKFRGDLKKGETLLVLGAGGNVGLAAVELGKLMGAKVIAAASSPEKLALCTERGADAVINYSTEDLKQRTKELTDGNGADVVYDAVGGDHAESALRATAWNGRFLVIGFAGGIPRIPLNLTLLKSCQIVGVFFGAMISREPETRDAVMTDLINFTESGELNPHVSKRYALDEAPQALQDLLDRKAVGKIVVEP